MLLKTRGIVFRALKYGETSVIADIFTEEKGLHSFIAGSVRTAKARMPFNLFQAMTVVDMVVYFRDDPNALNRLKEMRASELWNQIPFDIRRGAIVLFMAEICRKCIQESEENREMFDFLLDQLRWLDRTPHPIANLHLHFLLQLSGLLGFQPQGEPEPGKRVYFDLNEGVFCTEEPLHAAYLRTDQALQMHALLQCSVEECHTITMTRPERKALLQKLLQFYEVHVPGFSDVHTPDVLEMVMEG